MFNGTEVTRHRRILETSIGKAWNAETSLLRLATLILKHNGHEEGNGAIDVSFWQLRLNKWLQREVNGYMRSILHCYNTCKKCLMQGFTFKSNRNLIIYQNTVWNVWLDCKRIWYFFVRHLHWIGIHCKKTYNIMKWYDMIYKAQYERKKKHTVWPENKAISSK